MISIVDGRGWVHLRVPHVATYPLAVRHGMNLLRENAAAAVKQLAWFDQTFRTESEWEAYKKAPPHLGKKLASALAARNLAAEGPMEPDTTPALVPFKSPFKKASEAAAYASAISDGRDDLAQRLLDACKARYRSR